MPSTPPEPSGRVRSVTIAATRPSASFLISTGRAQKCRCSRRLASPPALLTLGRWRLAAGYAYADAEVRAAGPAASLDGLRPAQAPRHSASASVAWEGPRGAYASLGLRYAGNQYEDDLNGRKLPGARTVGAFLAWPLTNRLQLVARGENLINGTVIAGISDDGTVERATPRTIWIGLRLAQF